MNFKYKFKMFAKISTLDTSSSLHKEVASHMDVSISSQPDLLYFKAIYLSEGANKNGAVFHREELIPALESVYHKAMDIEHEEDGIVGHIYAASFADKDGNILTKEEAAISADPVDIVIAGIVYRDRFMELAEEIEEGKWYVSMETYYKDYYLTVGDKLRLDRDHPDIDKFEDYVGRKVVVSKDGEELANDFVYRHMKGLHFCGGGFVERPANPTSVIFETASDKGDTVVLELSGNSDSNQGSDDAVVIKLTASNSKKGRNTHASESSDLDLEYIETYISQTIDCFCSENSMYDKLKELEEELGKLKESAAKWTRAYINSLPDSAFVIIEPAYLKGKTKDKRARHLPYKDKNGKVDLPHLRNAAARCGKLKAVTDSISTTELRRKACAKVQKLVKKYLKKSK